MECREQGVIKEEFWKKMLKIEYCKFQCQANFCWLQLPGVKITSSEYDLLHLKKTSVSKHDENLEGLNHFLEPKLKDSIAEKMFKLNVKMNVEFKDFIIYLVWRNMTGKGNFLTYQTSIICNLCLNISKLLLVNM